MSRRRCRHRNTEVRWHQDRVRIPAPEEGPIYHYVELRRCVTCGELMGMGPSNDEWPEVRIEIRAAAIYAVGTTSGCTFDEVEGWYRYPDGNPVNDPQHQSLALIGWVASRHAGWLAHLIADHDELQRIGEPPHRHVNCIEPSCCFTDRCQAPADCRGKR